MSRIVTPASENDTARLPAPLVNVLNRVIRRRRTVIVLRGVLAVLAVLIIWHGLRGLQTTSMPPKGSWILEGQRIWTGQPAVRIAKFTITVGALLVVLAVISSLMLWRIGDMLQG